MYLAYCCCLVRFEDKSCITVIISLWYSVILSDGCYSSSRVRTKFSTLVLTHRRLLRASSLSSASCLSGLSSPLSATRSAHYRSFRFLLNRSIIVPGPELFKVMSGSQNELWQLLERDPLNAEGPSCLSTDRGKALKGKTYSCCLTVVTNVHKLCLYVIYINCILALRYAVCV